MSILTDPEYRAFRWASVAAAAAVILTIVLYIVDSRYTPTTAAVRAVADQGYTHVRITSVRHSLVQYHGCTRRDVVKFNITAVTMSGQTVYLYVCAGDPFPAPSVHTASP